MARSRGDLGHGRRPAPDRAVAAAGGSGGRARRGARALRDAHRRARVRLRRGAAERAGGRGGGDRLRRRGPGRVRDRPGWQRGRAVDLGRSRAPALTACAALLLGAALSAPAHAATVSVEGSTMRVLAAPGEQNRLTIGASAVTALGAPPTAGPGCTPASSGVTCLPTSGAFVDAADGDDTIDVRNGSTDGIWCGRGT